MLLNKKHVFALMLSIFLSNFILGQNIAPTLIATGNQAYCPKSQINIVTDFNIIDPDDVGIEALFVQISTGYSQGQDVLMLTNSHPNITTTWNILEGKLTLNGLGGTMVNYLDLIAAIKDVVFQSSSNNPIDKGFSITIGDANFLPTTGHYYEFVSSVGISWNNAKTAASARTYFGLRGYLATLTSSEEAQLAGEQASGAGWIGGSDAQTEGIWKWVTGPENGTVFWNGGINGSSPNYSNWNRNEPNQAGDEDYAHITAPGNGRIVGSWNDLSNTGHPSGDFQPKGYIVEYGGTVGDPVLNISASSSVYTNSITNTIPASRCGSGSVTLEATATLGNVLWFDTAIGGVSIGSGNTFVSPVLNSTTTYYALASIGGCVEGSRVPVVANITQTPIINNVFDNLVCDSGSAMLSVNTSAGTVNWYDVPTGGTSIATGLSFITPVVSDTTIYYVDATQNGCTTLSRIPVILTVQKTEPPVVAISNQSFCDRDQATLSSLVIIGSNILWYAASSGGSPLDNNDLLVNNTTYYASQTINDCESVARSSVTVQVYETVILPQASDIPVLSECDSDIDGDDTNGYSTFDLTKNETTLLNGKSSSDFSFMYYTDAGYSSLILTPSDAFVNTFINTQTIYVRIINNKDSTCYTDALFDIKVNELPSIQSSVLLKNCDEDGLSDGFTNFNLNEVDNFITNNNVSNFVISYYTSFSEAELEDNAISPIFNNQITNTVFARVENTEGCYRVSTINLQVSTTSFPLGYFEELTSCDDDDTTDGLHSFDLSQASNLFISQFPTGQNLSVHYYRNQNDAQLEQNEIVSNNYFNEIPFSQTIYVRVESDDNGACFGLGPHLKLTVHPRPEFEIDQTAIYCLDNNPISLVTFNANGNFNYQWTDDTGNVVSNSSAATAMSGGVYTVVATSILGCDSFPVTFHVVESAVASIDIEDVTIVELTNNNSITINNNNLGIGDYKFALDDINGAYQGDPYFDKVGAGFHTLYVKDENKCGIVSLDIFILGFPKYFTPNNDGENDTWQIKGLGLDFANNSSVNIYNRYGKLIKQFSAKNGEWDGTFNGNNLSTSDYWFEANLVKVTGELIIYRGHFSLVR